MKQSISIALCLTTVSAVWADVTLSSIIDSKMVLQRDIATPVWAGVIPLEVKAGEPVNAPDMIEKIPLPDYLS